MHRFIALGLFALVLAGCAGQKIQVTPEQAAGAAACFAQIQTVTATARAQVSSCEALARLIAAEVKAGQ